MNLIKTIEPIYKSQDNYTFFTKDRLYRNGRKLQTAKNEVRKFEEILKKAIDKTTNI